MRITQFKKNAAGHLSPVTNDASAIEAIACTIRHIIEYPPTASVTFSRMFIRLHPFGDEADTAPTWIKRDSEPDSLLFEMFLEHLLERMDPNNRVRVGHFVFPRERLRTKTVTDSITFAMDFVAPISPAGEPIDYASVIDPVMARIRCKIPPSRRSISGSYARMSMPEAPTVRSFAISA